MQLHKLMNELKRTIYVSVQYEAEKLSFGACKNLLPLPSKYTWGIWINQLAENVAATFGRLWTCSHWKNSLEMIDEKFQLLDWFYQICFQIKLL